MLNCRDDVLKLTHKLVKHQSVVNTEGEVKIAKQIHQLLLSLPYFQENPKHLLLSPTENDTIERYNVLALVRGTKKASDKTAILIGHLDTVGIEDYTQLKDLACQPEQLMMALKQEEVPPLVKRHLDSGEWLFGRGVLDMKSGVASNLYLLTYYAEHPDQLAGNLALVVECDEEDSSHGILSSLGPLKQWKTDYGLDYIAAINSDFVAPRYQGDENRYLYKGTVGKLLPSFFITGAETHVGSCFEGLDPNFIAAELTRQIDYNPDLCNEAYGEIPMPPVSLKQTDLKPSYTVQTALAAYVYYNFFIHSWTPRDVLEKLKEQATIAFTNALETYQSRYAAYCQRSGEPIQPMSYEPRVFTYEEINKLLKHENGDAYEQHMINYKNELLQDKSLDTRMYAARVVEEAWKWMKDKRPAIILFYSSLYSPRIELTGKNAKEQALISALEDAVHFIQPHYEHPIVIRHFFPYISDMSFVALSDDPEAIRSVGDNDPGWGTKQKVDYEQIRGLNVPVINIGPYGYDAHKKYERVELKYSLEIVPNLTKRVIENLF